MNDKIDHLNRLADRVLSLPVSGRPRDDLFDITLKLRSSLYHALSEVRSLATELEAHNPDAVGIRRLGINTVESVEKLVEQWGEEPSDDDRLAEVYQTLNREEQDDALRERLNLDPREVDPHA